MNKNNLLYWIITVLFGGFMIFTAVPNIFAVPESVAFITSLGYPEYLVPFLGWAKLFGVIAILVPGFPRISEWAYAGLFFDLAGATFSAIAIGGLMVEQLFMVLPFSFLFLSYYLYHQRIK